ncbi:hypothetical protein [Ornithinimicrobium kibberense]|uniref:hypothetical protein n=1 Tax=Ornithinimicrobium kibberense TaxID=282060 RepID=UPI003616FB1D
MAVDVLGRLADVQHEGAVGVTGGEGLDGDRRGHVPMIPRGVCADANSRWAGAPGTSRVDPSTGVRRRRPHTP